jgi:hypothetical protein
MQPCPVQGKGDGVAVLAGFWHPIGDDPGKQDPEIGGLSVGGDVVAGTCGWQTVSGASSGHGSAVGDGAVSAVLAAADAAGAAEVLIVSKPPSRAIRPIISVVVRVRCGSHRN